MARHFDVVGAVFSKALSHFSVSGSYGTSPNFVYSGTDQDGEPYQILEILYGGIPARPVGDGLDGHSWWPLFKAVPTEYLERYYPLRVEAYHARTTPAGRATTAAGTASPRRTPSWPTARSPSRTTARTPTVGRRRRQAGHALGEDARPGRRTEPERLPSKVEDLAVAAGDRLTFSTAGAAASATRSPGGGARRGRRAVGPRERRRGALGVRRRRLGPRRGRPGRHRAAPGGAQRGEG
jgi:N-methylhydantoinase B